MVNHPTGNSNLLIAQHLSTSLMCAWYGLTRDAPCIREITFIFYIINTQYNSNREYINVFIMLRLHADIRITRIMYYSQLENACLIMYLRAQS